MNINIDFNFKINKIINNTRLDRNKMSAGSTVFHCLQIYIYMYKIEATVFVQKPACQLVNWPEKFNDNVIYF